MRARDAVARHAVTVGCAAALLEVRPARGRARGPRARLPTRRSRRRRHRRTSAAARSRRSAGGSDPCRRTAGRSSTPGCASAPRPRAGASTSDSISRSRSNGFRVHGVVKSRHCARSHAALRRRSTGPSSPPNAERRSARRTPSGGSASTSCSQRPNASSNSRADAGSVSTSKSGSTPASTGRSRSKIGAERVNRADVGLLRAA